MERFVRHAGADAARVERIAKRLARDRHPRQGQQHREHVPRLPVAGARPRRQHAGGIGRETLEVALGERAPRREEFGQPRELRNADPRVDVGQIELPAGKRDVARAVGKVFDAVEAQRVDALRLRRVVDDERAAFDRRDVLVGMKAEASRGRPARRCCDCATATPARAPHPRSRAGRGAARAPHSASMSTSEPGQCVGMIAFVRGVIAASTWSRSMLRVTRSQSTNTGVAPTFTIMLRTVKKLCADVITSSPGPMPATCSATSTAAVADVSAFTGRPPQNSRQRSLERLDPGSARDPARAQHLADAGDGRLVEHRAGEFEIGELAHRIVTGFSSWRRARRRRR